jgi:hypothetical protein
MPPTRYGSSPGLSQFHLAKLPRRRFSLSKGGTLQHLGAFIVGIVVGFLGGLFGKGGSAIATPLLSLVGYPGFIAVASPLPATIPGTLVASEEYWQFHLLDWQIVWWSIAVGIPATILGSLLTKFTGSGSGSLFCYRQQKKGPPILRRIIWREIFRPFGGSGWS